MGRERLSRGIKSLVRKNKIANLAKQSRVIGPTAELRLARFRCPPQVPDSAGIFKTLFRPEKSRENIASENPKHRTARITGGAAGHSQAIKGFSPFPSSKADCPQRRLRKRGIRIKPRGTLRKGIRLNLAAFARRHAKPPSLALRTPPLQYAKNRKARHLTGSSRP